MLTEMTDTDRQTDIPAGSQEGIKELHGITPPPLVSSFCCLTTLAGFPGFPEFLVGVTKIFPFLLAVSRCNKLRCQNVSEHYIHIIYN